MFTVLWRFFEDLYVLIAAPLEYLILTILQVEEINIVLLYILHPGFSC
jgi:hypothetical protein